MRRQLGSVWIRWGNFVVAPPPRGCRWAGHCRSKQLRVREIQNAKCIKMLENILQICLRRSTNQIEPADRWENKSNWFAFLDVFFGFTLCITDFDGNLFKHKVALKSSVASHLLSLQSLGWSQPQHCQRQGSPSIKQLMCKSEYWNYFVERNQAAKVSCEKPNIAA